MAQALLHDLDEMAIGEIVVPVKKALAIEKASEYANACMAQMAPQLFSIKTEADNSLEAEAIVTAADRLDAVLYMASELAFGNKALGNRLPGAIESLEQAWFKLPAPLPLVSGTWHLHVAPSIRAHKNPEMHDYSAYLDETATPQVAAE